RADHRAGAERGRLPGRWGRRRGPRIRGARGGDSTRCGAEQRDRRALQELSARAGHGAHGTRSRPAVRVAYCDPRARSIAKNVYARATGLAIFEVLALDSAIDRRVAVAHYGVGGATLRYAARP